jgi:aromatase
VNSALSIDVHAPPRQLFELAADVLRWPELLPHYVSVTKRSQVDARVTVDMKARRPFGPLPFAVAWRAEQWADDTQADDLRLYFRHVHGATRGMEVTWRIRPHAGGSRVSIEHAFARPLPLVGPDLVPRLVNRLFIKPIATRTLSTFKALAEAPA